MSARDVKTIVLSNDPALLRALEGSALVREGTEVLTATDAAELLDRVTATAPALVLLAERVGTTSGAELCFRIKSDPSTAAVPVVLVGEAAEEVPADAFLPAPVDRATLVARAGVFLGLPERAWPRARKSLRVELSRDDGEVVGYTRDISAGGAFLRTPRPLAPGTELQMVFDLPGEEPARVRARGRVTRSVPQDLDSHLVSGVGVEFLRISDRDREEISRFVERRAQGPG